MVQQQEVITVEIDPESELAKALARAGTKAIRLVSNGQRYLVERDPAERDNGSDAEAFRAALQAAAGVFTPEEGEQLKQNIYRWREEGTGPDRRS